MHKPVHFKLNRGGHAPGYLRDAFASWIDDGMESETCEYDGEQVQAKIVFGMLWNCTDIMPSMMCELLDVRAGSTYAMGARKAKQA